MTATKKVNIEKKDYKEIERTTNKGKQKVRKIKRTKKTTKSGQVG